jgi:hypothetical protein
VRLQHGPCSGTLVRQLPGECVVGRGRRRGDIAAARRAYRACRMAPAAAAGHAAVARARRRGCALRWRGRPWLSSAGGTGGAPRSVLPDHKRIFFPDRAICDAEKDYYSIGRPICGNMALLFGRAGDANRSDRRPQPGGSLASALGTSATVPVPAIGDFPAGPCECGRQAGNFHHRSHRLAGIRRARCGGSRSSCRPLQYSSCSRTQLMVPALSLRPLGTRSSQLSAPISSSAPRRWVE